jgi:hypothetical protein
MQKVNEKTKQSIKSMTAKEIKSKWENKIMQ